MNTGKNSHIRIAGEGTEHRLAEGVFTPNPKMEIGEAIYQHDPSSCSPREVANKAKNLEKTEKWIEDQIREDIEVITL